MPRYRKLHVKITESLDVNEMPDDFTRLFWVLLPLGLCREGRGLDNAAWLKSRLFPLREDVSQEKVYAAFLWCVEHGMIERYGNNGRAYFYLPKFAQYQGDTSKEGESDYPAPPGETSSGPTPELVPTCSPSDADADADSDVDSNTTEDSLGILTPEPIENDAEFATMREAWSKIFPKKPQPRATNKTIRAKVKTRMKSEHFRDNWLKAMERAAKSKFVLTGGWFDFAWFVDNDEHYERCLNGKYDNTGPPSTPQRQGQSLQAMDGVQ